MRRHDFQIAVGALARNIAQLAYTTHGSEVARERARRPKRDRKQRAFGARSTAMFVIRPMDQRLKRRAAPGVRRTDPFGRIEFMPRHREQVDAKVIHRRCDLADRLGRIGVE